MFSGGILGGKRAANRQTSVILKRQVPIRFDEQPRSWLGGLPMVPEGTEWPRDREGAPLFFLAQIACEHLPAALWNGHGPRKGWLLLFVETMKDELGVPGNGNTKLLHTTSLGAEREPPHDTPTVRHTMSDYIDYAVPVVRPGVPKLWRKWPIDLVVQDYALTGDGHETGGAPCPTAEELYGAPVSEHGIGGDFKDLGLDRPLTWRGALYVVEGLVRDLQPDRFKRHFSCCLTDVPETDPDGFAEAFNACVAENPDWVALGIFRRSGCAITAQIEAKLKAERCNGWMARSYVALDRKKARREGSMQQYQQEIVAAGDCIDSRRLQTLDQWIASGHAEIARLEQTRSEIDALYAAYPGPDGEEAFAEEIRVLGAAHLAWGEKTRQRLLHILDGILSQNLEAPMPQADWVRIASSIEAEKTVFWRLVDTCVLAKDERSLSMDSHLRMAIREDILDLYTCGPEAQALLPEGKLKEIEEQLRYLNDGMPHRMGGHANRIQGANEPDEMLLFQFATDYMMGWKWGDVGALYVTISEKDLRKGKLDRHSAEIEGY